MLDKAKYVNHLNQSIDFGSGGIFITDSELRDYEWEYDTDYDEITNFRKGIKEKKMKIIISAVTEEEGIAKRNAVFRIFEADILANQAGKLYQVDAKLVISASVLAGILSLLTSVAGLPECNTEGE